MPYLVSSSANLSAVAPNRTLTTLLQHASSGLECRFVSTRVLRLVANTALTVPLDGITLLKLLAVQSTDQARIDVSISDNATTHFTTAAAHFDMRMWQNGIPVYELQLLSVTSADIQLCLAGD